MHGQQAYILYAKGKGEMDKQYTERIEIRVTLEQKQKLEAFANCFDTTPSKMLRGCVMALTQAQEQIKKEFATLLIRKKMIKKGGGSNGSG